MAQFSKEHLKLMREGLRLFNAQKYWECHEFLEDCWMEEPGPERNVYWAIIQVAASLFHYRQENLIGAAGMLNKAKQKFDRCESLHVESPLLNEKLKWQELKKMVRSVPSKPQLIDFDDLYQFRFEET